MFACCQPVASDDQQEDAGYSRGRDSLRYQSGRHGHRFAGTAAIVGRPPIANRVDDSRHRLLVFNNGQPIPTLQIAKRKNNIYSDDLAFLKILYKKEQLRPPLCTF